MWNRLSVGRSLIARSTRKYTTPPEIAGRSWYIVYWLTGAHGAELYCLTAYCALVTGFLTYNLRSQSLKNECSLLPYKNKEQF